MHFQFLIEDQSGANLIQAVMDRVCANNPDVTFNYKAFRGLGGFTKRNTVKETKTGKLLNDLATYLKGFNRSLQGIPAAIVVVLDNDDRNTAEFRAELESLAATNMITVDYIFCIAVEELEAWMLGDEQAIVHAYPNAKLQSLHSYVQDSICGTWEVLADVVYPGGCRKMKKDCTSYMEIGKIKSEWATHIGSQMALDCNRSPSFNYFISELNKRIVAA